MPVLTEVPDELAFRGIAPRKLARGFAISLDTVEPWGGGRVEGRVERRDRFDRHSVAVAVRCSAAWLDVAPQLVGKKSVLSLSTYWDIRTRAVPVWLDEELFVERLDVGPLEGANWRPVSFTLPELVPRAFEGTFVSFRWRIDVRRRRLLGHEEASLPLLLNERPTLPVVRIEESPLGTWRLLEWKSEVESEAALGSCSVRYEERRPEDLPLPGENREQELARLTRG